MSSDSSVPRWCQLCDGTGFVSVYHPLDVKAVREGCDQYRDKTTGVRIRAGVRDDGTPRHALASVPCKCSKGDKHALWFYSKQAEPVRMPRFGESGNHVRPTKRPGGRYDIVADVEACTVVEWEFS